MARRFRARGKLVLNARPGDVPPGPLPVKPLEELPAPRAVPVTPPAHGLWVKTPGEAVHVREEKTPPLPPAPWPTQPKTVESNPIDVLTDIIKSKMPVAETVVEMPGVADAAMAVRLGHRIEDDLTDAELEELTKPER